MAEVNKTLALTLFQWNTLSYHLSDKVSFPYAKDDQLKWENRLPLIKKILEENSPDVICLEELGNYDSGFKSDILDKLTIKYDIAFGTRTHPTLGINLGILIGVNKELFSGFIFSILSNNDICIPVCFPLGCKIVGDNCCESPMRVTCFDPFNIVNNVSTSVD